MPEETDIAKLLELKAPSFTWPKFLCPHCCAIHYQRPEDGERCQNSICHKAFPYAGASHRHPEGGTWMDGLAYPNNRYFVDFDNPIIHGRKLAKIKADNDIYQQEYDDYRSNHTMLDELEGEELREFRNKMPPKPWSYPRDVLPKSKALYTAIAKAEQFIHILTFGNQVGHGLTAALAMAAARGVSVRVLSGTPGFANGNKEALKNEAGLNYWYGTHFRRVPKDPENSFSGQPHHKLYVIDGMLAFYGSANSSDWGINGMLPDTLTDNLELYTDMKWIHEKHNELFSFWWTKTEPDGYYVDDHHEWRAGFNPSPPSDD